MNLEYLLVLVATVFFPFLFSFDRKLGLYRHAGAMVAAIAAVFFTFGLWDVVAVQRGHWSFNPAYILGYSTFGLPIEEWLFFVVVPFVSIFTWEAVKYFLGRRK